MFLIELNEIYLIVEYLYVDMNKEVLFKMELP